MKIRLIFLATALVLPAFGAQAGVVFTNLYSFNPGVMNGAHPAAPLVRGSDGNFYGTTSGGGTNSNGTVFKVSTNGALTTLYSFGGDGDGALPNDGLVQGSDGSFYGTTASLGTNGYGTLFKISTNGELTTLYSFTAGAPESRARAGQRRQFLWHDAGFCGPLLGGQSASRHRVPNRPQWGTE